MLSILNNVSAMSAENSLSMTQMNLQNTLTQLSTGSRINSGADDAAGLSIANGMQANIAALTQSSQNATNDVGRLQTADGALSQVTTLLNRAVTIATEAANGSLTSNQSTALDTEYTSIKNEIDQIGTSTNFNGQTVFTATAQNTFISDGITSGTAAQISSTVGALSSAGLGTATSGSPAVTTGAALTTTDLTNSSDAAAALTSITNAINAISAQRGQIGASVNRLTAATNVINSQVQNLTGASNGIKNADVGKTVANMTQYNILQSTGMAALQQANQSQQSVLKLLQ